MSWKHRSRLATGAIAIVSAAMLFGTWPGAASPESTTPSPTYLYRVHAPLGDSAQQLLQRGFDVLEARDGNDLFVLGSTDVADRLRKDGFNPYVEQVLDIPKWTPPARRGQASVLTAEDVNETYYGGYHTINAHHAHLDQVASQHSDLATVVDYGDSWRKTKGSGGYDLKAICITKKASGDCRREPNADKPRFFVMGQLHAREITTGDVAWRWIDHLVSGYGSDNEITKLLDTTEVWVVPIANPDGVEIVQQGGSSPVYQRKNANHTNGSSCGSSASNQIGVDLNRNMSSHWGQAGTSSQPCDQSYTGPSADSEVETKAMQQLWRDLYPDKRGTGVADPAPADTKGVVVSMHSYSNDRDEVRE